MMDAEDGKRQTEREKERERERVNKALEKVHSSYLGPIQ